MCILYGAAMGENQWEEVEVSGNRFIKGWCFLGFFEVQRGMKPREVRCGVGRGGEEGRSAWVEAWVLITPKAEATLCNWRALS